MDANGQNNSKMKCRARSRWNWILGCCVRTRGGDHVATASCLFIRLLGFEQFGVHVSCDTEIVSNMSYPCFMGSGNRLRRYFAVVQKDYYWDPFPASQLTMNAAAPWRIQVLYRN